MSIIRVHIAVLAAALGGAGLMATSLEADAGPPTRGGARSSVNHAGNAGGRANRAASTNRGGSANRSANVNRNTNTNRNTSVSRSTNVNRSTNIDVDVDNGWDNDWDHPIAAAAAVTTAAAVTAAAIGSIVYSVPPSCVSTVVNGIAYQQCGSTWYQPQYAGTQVQYVVVQQP